MPATANNKTIKTELKPNDIKKNNDNIDDIIIASTGSVGGIAGAVSGAIASVKIAAGGIVGVKVIFTGASVAAIGVGCVSGIGIGVAVGGAVIYSLVKNPETPAQKELAKYLDALEKPADNAKNEVKKAIDNNNAIASQKTGLSKELGKSIEHVNTAVDNVNQVTNDLTETLRPLQTSLEVSGLNINALVNKLQHTRDKLASVNDILLATQQALYEKEALLLNTTTDLCATQQSLTGTTTTAIQKMTTLSDQSTRAHDELNNSDSILLKHHIQKLESLNNRLATKLNELSEKLMSATQENDRLHAQINSLLEQNSGAHPDTKRSEPHSITMFSQRS